MGSMNNYKQLMEERKAIEEKTERLVLKKLSYLREVGRSVMTKTHGGYGWLTNSERKLSYLGEELEFWLTSKNLKLIRLEEFNIIFEHPKYGVQNPNRTLSIPRQIRIIRALFGYATSSPAVGCDCISSRIASVWR